MADGLDESAAQEIVGEIRHVWADARCDGALHVRRVPDGPAVEVDADRLRVLASVMKVPVALEFFSRVVGGDIDGTRLVRTTPDTRTPGPTGLSVFRDDASVSLQDMARLMLTVSDNAATDEIIAAVGLDAIEERLRTCGCDRTTIGSDIGTMLDGVALELGFTDYRALLDAQEGRLGPTALERSTDQSRIDALAALDPARTISSTARDMTTLLSAIAADTAGPPEACALVRDVMRQQVGGRFASKAPPGAQVAAKGGSLFGRIYNEVGLVTVDDATFAVAVLTSAQRPFVDKTAINSAITSAAYRSIEALTTRG